MPLFSTGRTYVCWLCVDTTVNAATTDVMKHKMILVSLQNYHSEQFKVSGKVVFVYVHIMCMFSTYEYTMNVRTHGQMCTVRTHQRKHKICVELLIVTSHAPSLQQSDWVTHCSSSLYSFSCSCQPLHTLHLGCGVQTEGLFPMHH